jgi:hypothetical protein
MFGSSKTSWIIQAVICLALIVWQVDDLISSKTSSSATMAIFNYVVLIFAILGLAGAIYALRSRPSSPS